MEIGIAEAKDQLPKLIRAVEDGEQVIITRHGKPVAQLARPPAPKRKVEFGWMKGKISYQPGWDDPITEDQFLRGDF